jgi:hypothetical protein
MLELSKKKTKKKQNKEKYILEGDSGASVAAEAPAFSAVTLTCVDIPDTLKNPFFCSPYCCAGARARTHT